MTREEIKRHMGDSERALEKAHDDLADSIRNDLKNFKKKTLDQI